MIVNVFALVAVAGKELVDEVLYSILERSLPSHEVLEIWDVTDVHSTDFFLEQILREVSERHSHL